MLIPMSINLSAEIALLTKIQSSRRKCDSVIQMNWTCSSRSNQSLKCRAFKESLTFGFNITSACLNSVTFF